MMYDVSLQPNERKAPPRRRRRDGDLGSGASFRQPAACLRSKRRPARGTFELRPNLASLLSTNTTNPRTRSRFSLDSNTTTQRPSLASANVTLLFPIHPQLDASLASHRFETTTHTSALALALLQQPTHDAIFSSRPYSETSQPSPERT